MFDLTQPISNDIVIVTIITIVLLTGLGIVFVKYRAKKMIKDIKK